MDTQRLCLRDVRFFQVPKQARTTLGPPGNVADVNSSTGYQYSDLFLKTLLNLNFHSALLIDLSDKSINDYIIIYKLFKKYFENKVAENF